MTGGFLQRLTGDAGGGPAAPAPVLRPVLRGTSPAFEDDASLWETTSASAEEAAPAFPTPTTLLSDAPARRTEPFERQEVSRQRTEEPPAQEARRQSAPISAPPSVEPFTPPVATPVPPRPTQASPEPSTSVPEQTPAPTPQGPERPLQTAARKAPDRSDDPSPARPGPSRPSIETVDTPAARPPLSAEIVPYPASAREIPDVRPAAWGDEPQEAAPAAVMPSQAPLAPALAPRARDAATALPLPEPPPAPAEGPKIEIGRLVVEVVRDAPEPAAPQAPAPRTAAQASVIGPIGDLRAGLRRFPGWG